jgi:predicted CxxxxCH...CXXCH cytochrome family protein
MRYTKLYLIIVLILGIVFTSCSDIQEELTLPQSISVHGIDFMKKSSQNFHGKKLVNNSMETCKDCHSSNLTGGTAKISCASSNCHPGILVHTEEMMQPNSQQFHGKFIELRNWDMSSCQQCHGISYTGGIVSPTCNSCHKNANGPEACNTCHGDFGDVTRTAPPRALNNSISTSYAGVGAHSKHLLNAQISSNIVCNECHKVPGGLSTAGHIDSTPKAELVFGILSKKGPSAPTYDFGTNKCSNTYCHGNFSFSKSTSNYSFAYTSDQMTGNNFSPDWKKVDGTQDACGTCHGLPPTGHMASELKACTTCHQGVIDATGKIIDKTKHINGQINVFGN